MGHSSHHTPLLLLQRDVVGAQPDLHLPDGESAGKREGTEGEMERDVDEECSGGAGRG